MMRVFLIAIEKDFFAVRISNLIMAHGDDLTPSYQMPLLLLKLHSV